VEGVFTFERGDKTLSGCFTRHKDVDKLSEVISNSHSPIGNTLNTIESLLYIVVDIMHPTHYSRHNALMELHFFRYQCHTLCREEDSMV
jgi:hypothetical protein